jgi:hypothetical protein
MPRILVLIAVATVTSLAVATTLARAAAPVRDTVSIDDTFVWDDCGFAVEEHDVGTLQFISWFDASGNRTRQIVTAPGLKITWTNPLTGASVTTANPFVVHKRDNPDGSATIAFTGLSFALNGGGTAYVDSGRDLIVFSDGAVELLSSVGPNADLCAALAATIG